MDRRSEHLRMVEALLFASDRPLSAEDVAERLPEDADAASLIVEVEALYKGRGVNLARVAGKWMFRTAPDLAFLLRREVEETRKLSRAGTETLAIIAYHQPVSRAEIEEIRGVSASGGTLRALMEAGWIRPVGRRRSPGRPVTYGTTEEFLVHFGLESLGDLPGIDELKAAGLLESIDTALSRMEREAERATRSRDAEGHEESEEGDTKAGLDLEETSADDPEFEAEITDDETPDLSNVESLREAASD